MPTEIIFKNQALGGRGRGGGQTTSSVRFEYNAVFATLYRAASLHVVSPCEPLRITDPSFS